MAFATRVATAFEQLRPLLVDAMVPTPTPAAPRAANAFVVASVDPPRDLLLTVPDGSGGTRSRGNTCSIRFRKAEHGALCRHITQCDFAKAEDVERYIESGCVRRCRSIAQMVARKVGERCHSDMEGEDKCSDRVGPIVQERSTRLHV